MHKLILIASFMAMGTANATDRNNPLNQQGQWQAQAQTQESSQNVQTNAYAISSRAEARRPVNTPYAPTVYSANECMGSTSAGGTGFHIGLAFGTTWKDKDCALFKAASDFEQAGYKADALVIRCQSELAKNAPSCVELRK